MQNCLGIYIEDNLIKYAKVSKEKNGYKVDAFGMNFFDENVNTAVKKVIEETYSFNTPISINLANEKYLYFDVFSLLAKKDIEKTVQTEFETYCEEKNYNYKTFETRFALTPNVEDSDKIRAIEVAVNKNELNRQKQLIGKYHLVGMTPIGTAIASIARIGKKENVLIVNMEDKTSITTVYDRQIYEVETIDTGSANVIEKINQTENSLKRTYEICKETTIYTAEVIEDTKEQPYLEYIIPTLYEICQKVKEKIENSSQKINAIYLTGTLSAINNIDLYFQEFFTSVDCKILRPSIMEESSTHINIKDYIEVNSAISLAVQVLGEGSKAFNFKKASASDDIKSLFNKEIGHSKTSSESKKIDFKKSFSEKFDKSEIILTRCIVAIILINIIYIAFAKTIYSQMSKKETEVETLTTKENSEISKMNNDMNSLNSKNTKYTSLISDLKNVNDKISDASESKNLIPNLLNQLMFVIPESVQLTSIENTTDKKIVIGASASGYEQLGYFIAKLKVEGILNNVVSSSGQKNNDEVTVTIEGELP